MGTEIITEKQQATTNLIVDSGLAVEVVDALYPQWSVNGHDIPAAFETIAERHHDPAIRHNAATTPLLPALTATLERVFWVRARAERAMQRA